jgi:hypothetical protein
MISRDSLVRIEADDDAVPVLLRGRGRRLRRLDAPTVASPFRAGQIHEQPARVGGWRSHKTAHRDHTKRGIPIGQNGASRSRP